MKKLMIAAVAVFAAVAANAATANWSINAQKIYSGDEELTAYAGGGFVFDNSKMTQAALYAIIAGGTEISSGTTGYVADIAASKGSVAATKFSYGTYGEETSPAKYNFYMVFVDEDKAYFSNVKELAAPTAQTAKSITMGSQNNGTDTFSDDAPTASGFAGAGKWSAVPEPTSGLLLLLGVAGLALKRKRA